MRKLAYIFCIALFLFGCATSRSMTVNVSYDPIDYPPQFFSLKDKRPTLYLDSVIDNREFAVEVIGGAINGTRKMGRFKEDSTLYFQMDDHLIPGPINQQYRISKPPSEIIREALETEVHRFGIKTVKDRGLADGVLKASIEEFGTDWALIVKGDHLIKINLNLYQTGFDDPVWSGMLKGKPEKASGDGEMLNTTLNMAIKSWYSYPGFKEALVRLAGNVSSPPSSQQPPQAVESVYSGTGFLFSAKDYVITNWHIQRSFRLALRYNRGIVEGRYSTKQVK